MKGPAKRRRAGLLALPIVLGLALLTAPGEAGADIGYVTIFGAGPPGTVQRIDSATDTVVGAPIPVGIAPAGVVVRQDGARAYVANSLSGPPGTVSVINTTTNTVVTTIPTRAGAAYLALSPADGRFLYVSNRDDSTVSVIDTATNLVRGAPIPVGTNPFGLAVTPDGTRVFVVNSNGGNVSVISIATNTVIKTIPVGLGPRQVAFNLDGSRAYVTNANSASVSVINTATNAVVKSIPVGAGPYGITVAPNGARAYATNATDGAVSVIDTATNTVVKTITVGGGPAGLALPSDGSKLYATSGLTGPPHFLRVVNPLTNIAGGTIATGPGPIDIAFVPGQAAPPVRGRSLVVAPVSGKVLIRRPGSTRFVPLAVESNIPVGSTLDTTKGRVELTAAANRSGKKTQSAVFFDGLFSVAQRRGSSLTTAVLRGGDFGACSRGSSAGGERSQAARRKRRKVRRLWGNGKGRFRTRGKHSSTSVRGTFWLTEDRCEGTLTKVRRGRVSVRDFARKRTVTVRAGHSYLARAR